jgi:hypothetical protein
MSQQPPPPPYGGPPGPPGSYPAFPQGPGQQPPQGMSNTAKFWIGAALSLPVMAVVAFATSLSSGAVGAITGSHEAGGIASFMVGMVLLVAYVAAVVWEKTRWFALGVLAGGAVLLILAAGACVVLLAVIFSGAS